MKTTQTETEPRNKYLVAFYDPRDGGTIQTIIRAYDACEAEDIADDAAGRYDFRGPNGEAPKRLKVELYSLGTGDTYP